MRQLIAIIAFVGILLQSFSNMAVYVSFYLHKDYIAKNLCENRNKPNMKCCGKCCLKKQLAKQQKQDQLPGSQNQKDKQGVVLFYAYSKPEIVSFSYNNGIADYIGYNNLLTISFPHTVFRPPIV